MDSSQTPYNGALTLSPLNILSGMWKCEATNEFGVISTTFIVTVLGKQWSHFNCINCGCLNSVVTLT